MLIVGDVHGNTKDYYNLVRDAEYSLQLGDLGFASNYKVLSDLNSDNHKVVAGNHDDYPIIESGTYPHFLGDYGCLEFGGLSEAFYVRGGRSIDYKYRKLGFDYFEQEELTYLQGYKCLEEYQRVKPKIVFSHECPSSVICMFPSRKWDGEWIRPSHTSHILQAMLEVHEPELWMFGHYHLSRNEMFGKCNFVCLAELETYEL